MPKGKNIPLNPDVADTAPTDEALTPYDIEHTVTYLRLLDADKEGADWREVCKIVLHIDPEADLARAQLVHQSHLALAKWLAHAGYKRLLRGDIPNLN
jgi:hypothetical protein